MTTIARSPVASPALRRVRIPLITLALLAIALVLLSALPGDMFDRGMRRTFGVVACVIAGIMILVWFLVLSGATLRVCALTSSWCLWCCWRSVLASRSEMWNSRRYGADVRFRLAPVAGKQVGRLSGPGSQEFPAYRGRGRQHCTAPSPEDSPTYRGLHCDGVVEGPALRPIGNGSHPSACGGTRAGAVMQASQSSVTGPSRSSTRR